MHTHSSLRRTFSLTFAVTLAVAVAAAGTALASTSHHHKPPIHKTTNPLAGKWSGTYGGAYSGSFTVQWTQNGSKLKGTIALTKYGTYSCDGTVNGSTISFGTVGGPEITYTGSWSGSSMSGNYNTPGGGGSWSANKTS